MPQIIKITKGTYFEIKKNHVEMSQNENSILI